MSTKSECLKPTHPPSARAVPKPSPRPPAAAPADAAGAPSADAALLQETRQDLARARKALSMWLLWHEAYEESVADLYGSKPDLSSVEAKLDQLDELREQAKQAAQSILKRH